MKQIEEMYEESGNKVTLVAHSMGAPTSLYFLNTDNGIVTQQWKDQYIHAYVTLSGAWAGSPILLQEVISGNNLGLPGDILDKFFRSISRTLESSVWLFPYPDIFKSTIVSTPTRNYNANDYMTLFKDIDYPTGYSMYKGVENINRGFPDPKVHTHCYWGLGTKTPLSYYYNKSLPVDTGYDPSGTNYSDGDGRVNDIASEVCLRWANTEHKTFEGVTHGNMVTNVTVLDAIAKVVTNLTAEGSKFHPKYHHDRNKDDMFNEMTNLCFTSCSSMQRMVRKLSQRMVSIQSKSAFSNIKLAVDNIGRLSKLMAAMYAHIVCCMV